MKKSKVASFAIVCCIVGMGLAGCSDNNILKIGGNTVSEEEYRYQFMNNKMYYDYYGYDVDGTAADDDESKLEKIKTETINSLLSRYAVTELAAENKVSLDKEEQQAIDDQMDETAEKYGGEEALRKELMNQYMTPELLRSYLESNQLSLKLFNQLYGDKVIDQINTEGYLRAKHILIPYGESEEEAKARAEEVLEKVNAGENFDELIGTYGEDPGMDANPDGYYFGEGEMVSEFYEGTKSLEVGKTSGLVPSEFGYHIIQRLEVHEDELIEYLTQDGRLVNIASEEIMQEYDALMTSKIGQLKVKYLSKYDKITLNSFENADESAEGNLT